MASCDKRLRLIADEVRLTSVVMTELDNIFSDSVMSGLMSDEAKDTAKETIIGCQNLFQEIGEAVQKSKGRMGSLLYPFKKAKVQWYHANLERLKSNLQLLMRILLLARSLANSEDKTAITEQRAEIDRLLRLKNEAIAKYDECQRHLDAQQELERAPRQREPGPVYARPLDPPLTSTFVDLQTSVPPSTSGFENKPSNDLQAIRS